MASYDDWNSAIARAFTEGVASGTPVYLAIDESTLEAIGGSAGWTSVPGRTWTADFLAALTEIARDEVNLPALKRRTSLDNPPRGVAFLAAMVLAASRMAEDEEHSDNAYFTRLCEVLELPPVGGGLHGSQRPLGLEGAGAEEPLWLAWNAWLLRRGLLPTASRGSGISDKFVSYPLQQALVRDADRQRLEARFAAREGQLPAHCDPGTLAAIMGSPRWPTAHLSQLMQQDTYRRAAAEDAVFEAYEAWRSWREQRQAADGTRAPAIRRLAAGVFREWDPVFDEVSYRLLPRMRRGIDPSLRPRLQQGGDDVILRPLRAGWYEPAGVLEAEALDGGLRLPLSGLPGIDAVDLPQRSFWMLVPDPEDPESGQLASWGPPRLGEPFILLCRESLAKDLELLRAEALVHWEGDPIDTVAGWREYRGLLAISEAWEGVHTANEQLLLELRPASTLSVSVRGGLRAPSGAWLAGSGPEVVVHGFERNGELMVMTEDGALLAARPFRVNEPVEGLAWDRPGSFKVQATTPGEASEQRIVRVAAWDQLVAREPAEPQARCVGGFTLRGASLEGTLS